MDPGEEMAAAAADVAAAGTRYVAKISNCRFNTDADTSHHSGEALWAPVNLALDLANSDSATEQVALSRHQSCKPCGARP